jgi:hypothetical protein
MSLMFGLCSEDLKIITENKDIKDEAPR